MHCPCAFGPVLPAGHVMLVTTQGPLGSGLVLPVGQGVVLMMHCPWLLRVEPAGHVTVLMTHCPCAFGVLPVGQTPGGGLALMNVHVTVSPGPTLTCAVRVATFPVLSSVLLSAHWMAVNVESDPAGAAFSATAKPPGCPSSKVCVPSSVSEKVAGVSPGEVKPKEVLFGLSSGAVSFLITTLPSGQTSPWKSALDSATITS